MLPSNCLVINESDVQFDFQLLLDVGRSAAAVREPARGDAKVYSAIDAYLLASLRSDCRL